MAASFDIELAGAGGAMALRSRWVLTGELVLQTTTHLGGQAEGICDAMVLRDPTTGAPLLPGSSLAGALRSHLADRLGDYRSREHDDVVALFGGTRQAEDGGSSPLLVFDSVGVLPEGAHPEIRDGVAIEAARGIAEDHKKYDIELLPAGTVFPVRMELAVPEDADEAHLIGLWLGTLAGIDDGDLVLGARRTRGLGATNGRDWRAARFDLTGRNGWLSWLQSDHERPLGAATPSHARSGEALRGAWRGPAQGPQADVPNPCPDNRTWARIELDLDLPDGILVRSPGLGADEPDVSHLVSSGGDVLPGTSQGGVLRLQALRIAQAVLGPKSGPEYVEALFGPRMDGDVAPGFQPRASRLRTSETRLQGGERVRTTRNRIDRFSQGTVDGALFDEEVLFQAGGHTSLVLRRPREADIGMLLLLVKDLLDARMSFGGTGSIGRGSPRVRRAAFAWRAEGGDPKSFLLRDNAQPQVAPAPGEVEILDRCIKAFRALAQEVG